MSGFRLRRPSPALAVSFVALLVAFGGTSYAAFSLPKNSVGAKQLKNGAVTTNKIKNDAVTAGKINPLGLNVPNSLHANSADTAANATNATIATNALHASSADTATTASNALSLGGVPASGYTRNDCNSTTGQVKGFAYVPASPTFSATLVSLDTFYNCSGQAVQARRISAGEYEVKFVSNPALIAIGSVNVSCGAVPCDASVSVSGSFGDWEVSIYSAVLSAHEDYAFELIVP